MALITFGLGSFGYITYLALMGESSTKKNVIILFTRYPIPRKTKTRLIPTLGTTAAANTQLLMTNHMLDILGKFLKWKEDCQLVVQYHGGTKQQMAYWLGRKTMFEKTLTFREQEGSNLGERLSNAAHTQFEQGAQNILIIGSDIPGIDEAVLEKAFSCLEQGERMVLGRAADGGYYCIGFRKEVFSKTEDIFKNVDWGSGEVYQQQVKQSESLGIKVRTLPTVLTDVDNFVDLKVFEKEAGVRLSALTGFRWSIVIPVLNEAASISHTLCRVLQSQRESKNNKVIEIIVCDGGSHDDTIKKVEEFAKYSTVPVNIIHSQPGRGFQLYNATAHASGDYLLFLHGDTLLPKNFNESAAELLVVPGIVAGAFHFELDALKPPKCHMISWFFKLKLRILVWLTNWRCYNAELPYGDQALFMSRRSFDAVGGWDKVYLMEDYILVKKLHTLGHVGLVPGESVVTSARRWEKNEVYKVTALNSLICLAYNMGISPNTLARWYYGRQLKTSG
ncbi:hypothetical protein ScPMuIL_007678 [Solemya velum]